MECFNQLALFAGLAGVKTTSDVRIAFKWRNLHGGYVVQRFARLERARMMQGIGGMQPPICKK